MSTTKNLLGTEQYTVDLLQITRAPGLDDRQNPDTELVNSMIRKII